MASSRLRTLVRMVSLISVFELPNALDSLCKPVTEDSNLKLLMAQHKLEATIGARVQVTSNVRMRQSKTDFVFMGSEDPH